MKVECDVIKCKHNINCQCTSEDIHISINHIEDSNGNDYTLIIECDQQEI